MKVDIQKYIQGCLQCQIEKLVRVKTKNPMVITDTPTTAFEKISMDIVGPLPETKSGNLYILTIQYNFTKYSLAIPLPNHQAGTIADAFTPTTAFEKISMDIVGPLPEPKSRNLYILTIQDNFTKYSLAKPLPNHQAGTIADAFVKKFICIFGSPKGVLTDQGRDFLSNVLKRLAKRFRINQFRTTAFYPQSNGSLERSHHVLGEYLKQFVARNSEWDDWLE